MAAWLAAILLVSGCARMPAMPENFRLLPGSGTIHVDVPAPAPAPDAQWMQGRAVSLSIADFADARPGAPGRKVGNIRGTVRDMHATELVLDQDVRALLAGAVKASLVADGFRVVPAGDAADFRLDATVRTFTLDVAGRDELAIEVDAMLRAGTDAGAAWKGIVVEKSDRYAGVSGNSSASIAEYLGEGVAALAGKLGTAVKSAVIAASPSGAARAPVQPRSHDVPLSRDTGERSPPAATGVGRLSVQTVPARAKVYVDEVYYGLTPLQVELQAGIVQVRIVRGGYRPVTEKVSVRRGDTTELEVSLEK